MRQMQIALSESNPNMAVELMGHAMFLTNTERLSLGPLEGQMTPAVSVEVGTHERNASGQFPCIVTS
jgi:hypothetical protein